MVGVGTLLILAALVYSTFYFGLVRGQEFAADSFNRREFSFYQIPLVGLQITPINRRDITNDLESYLIAQKFIAGPSPSAATKRWDLVLAHRGFVPDEQRPLSQGEARILCEYLDAGDAKGNHIWLDWTKNNSAIAKVVWPAVAQVARQELYFFAPELLICARNATNAVELQRELDALLADKYLAFGNIQQQLDHHEEAVELFTSALVHAPARVEALVARAKSLTSLGKSDKASADVKQAERL